MFRALRLCTWPAALVISGATLAAQRPMPGPAQEPLRALAGAAAKVYRQDGYNNRGQIRRFTGTIEGRVWRFTGTNTSAAGRVTYERFTVTYDPDLLSATVRSEHSADGVQWFERLTGRYTKTSPEESGR